MVEWCAGFAKWDSSSFVNYREIRRSSILLPGSKFNTQIWYIIDMKNILNLLFKNKNGNMEDEMLSKEAKDLIHDAQKLIKELGESAEVVGATIKQEAKKITKTHSKK